MRAKGRGFLGRIRGSVLVLAVASPGLVSPGGAVAARLVAVAWDDPRSGGLVGGMSTRPPFELVTPGLATGGDAVLHGSRGRLYALARADDTLAIVHPRRWTIERVLPVGPGCEAEDVAVVSRRLAYLSCRDTTWIRRLDLRTGAFRDAIDLGAFADDDGVPDLGALLVQRGRLFVQIQRRNDDAPLGLAAPAYLAVIDLASETLVDADPAAPGRQAIELAGTAPKLRMQVLRRSRRLFVSATGAFFDRGGIEAIDLRALATRGLVLRESDGQTGADLGAFVLGSARGGFLVYSTDLDLSSHLKRFSLPGGVESGPDLHVAVGYAVPALALDTAARRLFLPDGGSNPPGVHVFDARTGERLTDSAVPTDLPPSDLVLLD